MVANIADMISAWTNMGIFSYFLPFMLIFSLVFSILEKTKMLGDNNKTIEVIISVSSALLMLQFDFVSNFFDNLFPKAGVMLGVLLVFMIFVGFFFKEDKDKKTILGWFGLVLGAVVIVWALLCFNDWVFYYPNFFSWLGDYFWTIVLLVGMVVLIVLGVKGPSPQNSHAP